MRKILLVIMVALLLSGVIYGYLQYQRTNQDLRQVTADQTVTVSRLVREFVSDDINADRRYRKRVLAVRGIVRLVDTSNNGVSVILKDSFQNATIRFSMDQPWNEIAVIRQGMLVTIKGILNGYSQDPSGLLGNEIVFNRGIWMPDP